MNDALVVDGLESFGDLGTDSTDAQGGNRTAGDGFGQGFSIEKLHDQVRMPFDQAKVRQRNDVGVVDHRGGLRFLDESLPRRLFLGLAQHLDGDGLAQRDVTRLIDDAHATFAEPSFDGVAVVDGRAYQLVFCERRRINQWADMDRASLVARSAAATSCGIASIWAFRVHRRKCASSALAFRGISDDRPSEDLVLCGCVPARTSTAVVVVDG